MDHDQRVGAPAPGGARLDSLLELSAAFQSLAHHTEDHQEAVNAFVEKRAPQFTGR